MILINCIWAVVVLAIAASVLYVIMRKDTQVATLERRLLDYEAQLHNLGTEQQSQGRELRKVLELLKQPAIRKVNY